MSFAEVKVFQVYPEKVEAFETLLVNMVEHQKTCPGCQEIRYVKRFYTYDDGIQDPPRPLKKVVGAVRYLSFWEFDSIENYHSATQDYFARFEKSLRKLLKAPFDIHCGYTLGKEQDD